ncbi:uncharacterized protein LOC131874855 [Cryptomeria japonica]|uniref:uncharacterized protein LOC131874855 n=1 Tax=Cryptomeria japonica TaxID=3369 RepID=UPI0027DA352D|nr:uncharacterized protein LOC131874855 [Cryptomeria japonica]
MQFEVVGFNELKALYLEDLDFAEAWKDCKELVTLDRTKWLDFIIRDDILFKGSQLCIPRSSLRDNLIKDKHSGGIAGHSSQDKTIAIISEHYYWPELSWDVKKFVQSC